MRPITKCAMCAICAAAIAAPALAASDYYLKFGDVKGKSAAGVPQIVITSWSFGKYGAVAGAHRDDGLSQPLHRGSVRVKVKFPWLGCAVGTAFPDAVLQTDAARYEFQEAIITGCAMDGVGLNYTKVQVRGWDPATKK